MGRIQNFFETLEILPKSFAKDIEPSFGALESFGILFSLSRASLGSKKHFGKKSQRRFLVQNEYITFGRIFCIPENHLFWSEVMKIFSARAELGPKSSEKNFHVAHPIFAPPKLAEVENLLNLSPKSLLAEFSAP